MTWFAADLATYLIKQAPNNVLIRTLTNFLPDVTTGEFIEMSSHITMVIGNVGIIGFIGYEAGSSQLNIGLLHSSREPQAMITVASDAFAHYKWEEHLDSLWLKPQPVVRLYEQNGQLIQITGWTDLLIRHMIHLQLHIQEKLHHEKQTEVRGILRVAASELKKFHKPKLPVEHPGHTKPLWPISGSTQTPSHSQ
jgi:hypothetical protein